MKTPMQDLGKYTKRDHVEIKTSHLSLLMASFIAILGLVFALGVVLGRRPTNDNPCVPNDPLAILDQMSGEPSPKPSQAAANHTFYHRLSNTRKQVPTPASLLSKGSIETVVHRRRPAQLTTPRHEEPAVLPTVPHWKPGVYSLQVGSFQSHPEASQLVQQLTQAGHSAFLVSVSMPSRGGTWYRVRVGPFKSKQKAWQYKQLFEEKREAARFCGKT